MKKGIIKFLGLSTIFMLLMGCGNAKETENNVAKQEEKTEEQERTITQIGGIPRNEPDFYALGENDSWKLEIRYGIGVVFMDSSKNISFLSRKTEEIVAQGANVVTVFSENDEYSILITIDVTDCGEKGKNVNVVLTTKKTNKETEYSTCGFYRGDMDLHGVWTVVKIDNEEIEANKFPKEPPHFSIDLDEKTISGFAGCNQVNGKLYFDYNHFLIENLLSTRMYCSEFSEIEEKILLVLRNNPVYKIENFVLTLQTEEGKIILTKNKNANKY